MIMIKNIYTAALIGTGRIGFTLGFDKKREQPASHTMALLGNRRIKLVAAADTDLKKLEEWKQYVKKHGKNQAKNVQIFSSSEDLYKTFAASDASKSTVPDIITIAVNEASHLEECIKAIKARPQLVILEKPVALNSTEAKKIADTAWENQVSVMINHERRFAADYNEAKAFIKKIGKLQSVRGELYSGLRIYGKEFESDGSYSLLHDGTHLVDIISWLLEENLHNPIVTGIFCDDKSVVRNFSAHYKTASCPDVSIYMSGRSRFFSFGIDILGTEGRISIGNGYAKFYKRKESKLYSGFYSLSKDTSIRLPKKTGYFSNMIQNAVDFLDEAASLKSPLDDAIKDLRTLEEIKAAFCS